MNSVKTFLFYFLSYTTAHKKFTTRLRRHNRISSWRAEDVTVALPINRHATSLKINSSTAQQHTHLPRLFTTVQIPQLKGRANVLITLSRSLFFSRLSSAHTHTHTPNLCYSHTDSY